MDFSGEERRSGLARPGSVTVVFQYVTGCIAWLTRIFTLTGEEKLKAGIILRKNQNDGQETGE